MGENPYEAPKNAAHLDATHKLPRPLSTFLVTTGSFYAIKLLAFTQVKPDSANGMLLACTINLPAMPFFAALIGIVETQMRWIKKQIQADLVLFCLLVALGPILWGLFAAYVSSRRLKIT